MFQVIHPPYKKVTLACIACLCFEIRLCPWPDLSALFQYTSPTPVVSLHLIPRIQYHQGIPVTLLTGSIVPFCGGGKKKKKATKKTKAFYDWATTGIPVMISCKHEHLGEGMVVNEPSFAWMHRV